MTLKGRKLTWSAVPDAGSYEVWRANRKLTTTAAKSVRVTKAGRYRVRGVNVVGFGPFTGAH